ncbi:MAG: polyphosphate kinase 1 [Candidatus Rariloculaceae bacterium]
MEIGHANNIDTPNLRRPDYYINRQPSQIDFNFRVLHQAKNNNVPLLERLKFLCISCTNLDEFFEVRMSGLKTVELKKTGPIGLERKTTRKVLQEVYGKVRSLVVEQYRVLNYELIPELENSGIRFLRQKYWNKQQQCWLEKYFKTEIVPVLSPATFVPTRSIPRVLNKSLNLIISFQEHDAFGRFKQIAIIEVPRSLPDLVQLPTKLHGTGGADFVLLTSIIHAFVNQLFVDRLIQGCHQFRLTRNSDFYLDPEKTDDIVTALEGGLLESRYGEAVRLETDYGFPEELAECLLDNFGLNRVNHYQENGPVDLGRLLAVYDMVDDCTLKYPPFTPAMPVSLAQREDIFEVISKKDILLHHPFQSFSPVLDFLCRAAIDPNVVAIKQTLYRVGGANSPMVERLVQAAKAGKEVSVMIELRARFDEAVNIELADQLRAAGVKVFYGAVGYKTHCKMLLVVRREGERLRRYTHLGTGNYHAGTARVYSDYGLLTANDQIGQDVDELFRRITSLTNSSITSLTKAPDLKLLFQSPFNLRDKLLELIKRETAYSASGRSGHIIAKINALVEPDVIRALFEASIAGVRVDLIVRGICCLRPNLPIVSENIYVRSIVGRFLEHSRCYYFQNNDDEEVFCASADWMDRSLDRRIEVMYPVLDHTIKKRIIRDLHTYLADNSEAWLLKADGTYQQLTVENNLEAVSAQSTLLSELYA